jgi:hypothetical protein
MQLSGDVTVGIFRTHRARVADHGDTVAMFKVVVAVGTRDDPCQCFRQLRLRHESKINGGCDIMVDVEQMRRISRLRVR